MKSDFEESDSQLSSDKKGYQHIAIQVKEIITLISLANEISRAARFELAYVPIRSGAGHNREAGRGGPPWD